jgi:hypothetical protein
MNKKYFDSRKGSVEATINTIRSEQKTIVKEEPKVSLQPKSYFGQKKDSLADVAAKVVSVNENIEVYITKKGSGPVNKRSIVKDFNNKAEAEKWIKWYKTGNMKDVESIYLSIQEDVESIKLNEDTDYLKSKLNTHQINNIKNTWKSKKASDVTPAVKALIKKMDIPTQLAIKQADIPHLSKLIEVNEDTNIYIGNDKKEDTDIDSVNDVALKNAEKSKSKDKDTKESKALTKEEQDHIKKEFGIKYEALSPEKQKQMDQLMKDFLARGGKIKKLKPGIAKGAGHLDRRGPYKADMLKGPKKHLAAQKDNSDELAGGKTATGQKVSKVDTRPNIREV